MNRYSSPHTRLRFGLVKIVALISFLSACDNVTTYRVKSEHIVVDSLSQILPIGDSLVRPVTYNNVRGLEYLPVPQIKEKFIAMMLPSILIVKHEVATVKIKIEALLKEDNWNTSDSTFYLSIKEKYKATDPDDLLLRLETVPTSIVLAQAAVESGWGQSRFFVEANNIFGIWSYRKNEPRIAAGQKRGDDIIYLRKYDSILESVHDYFISLARARSYRSLRKAMKDTDDPFELLPHLKYYSERRNAYINQLKRLILHNDLTRYDHYQIDPEYLVEE